jgi:hypothetical protein
MHRYHGVRVLITLAGLADDPEAAMSLSNTIWYYSINLKVAMNSPERQLEETLIEKLRGLKYEHRPDIAHHQR